MTKAEQDRMFADLVPLEYAMKWKDREVFRKLLSRQKDEEELDSFAAENLSTLHAAYKPNTSKEDLEARWRDMTARSKGSS